MIRAWVVALALAATCGTALAQTRLADDLCNYPVEGLTLSSTKAEIDAKFNSRGWHDLSTRGEWANTTRPGEVWQFERTNPPKEQRARGGQAGDATFKLVVGDGVRRSISFGRVYSGEDDIVSLDGEPGLLKRAEEACRLSDPRFRIRGCQRIKPGSNLVSITIEPATIPSTPYCVAGIGGNEGKTFGLTVTLKNAPLAGKSNVR